MNKCWLSLSSLSTPWLRQAWPLVPLEVTCRATREATPTTAIYVPLSGVTVYIMYWQAKPSHKHICVVRNKRVDSVRRGSLFCRERTFSKNRSPWNGISSPPSSKVRLLYLTAIYPTIQAREVVLVTSTCPVRNKMLFSDEKSHTVEPCLAMVAPTH